MSLPWFHTIKVGSIYLTDDGLVTGTPKITTVRGLDVLADAVVVQQIIAADGTPHQQTSQPVKGVPLVIECGDWMERDMYFDLKSIRLAAVTGSTTVTIQLLDNGHGTGDWNLTAYFNSIRFPGEFQSGRVKDVTLNFTVSSVGHLITASPGTLTLTGQEVDLTQA